MVFIGLVLLVVVTVFALQNPDPVTIKFLGWQYPIQLGVALIASGVIGAFIIYLSGLFTQGELRARVRSAESRLREAERQRQAAGNEPTQGTRP